MSNACYVEFNRFLFYLTGLRLLAPIKHIRALRKAKNQYEYTSMLMRVVDMSRVIKKGGNIITRNIKVGVITIHPYECILNSFASLLRSGALLPSEKRFMKMGQIPNNISDVVLYKIAGDKGGGSFKLTINPVNVQHP